MVEIVGLGSLVMISEPAMVGQDWVKVMERKKPIQEGANLLIPIITRVDRTEKTFYWSSTALGLTLLLDCEYNNNNLRRL